MRWYHRRSNQLVVLFSALIGVMMGLMQIYKVGIDVYAFIVGTANFALGRWYQHRQLLEEGRLRPQTWDLEEGRIPPH